jgi:hypothetical protein
MKNHIYIELVQCYIDPLVFLFFQLDDIDLVSDFSLFKFICFYYKPMHKQD